MRQSTLKGYLPSTAFTMSGTVIFCQILQVDVRVAYHSQGRSTAS